MSQKAIITLKKNIINIIYSSDLTKEEQRFLSQAVRKMSQLASFQLYIALKVAAHKKREILLSLKARLVLLHHISQWKFLSPQQRKVLRTAVLELESDDLHKLYSQLYTTNEPLSLADTNKILEISAEKAKNFVRRLQGSLSAFAQKITHSLDNYRRQAEQQALKHAREDWV